MSSKFARVFRLPSDPGVERIMRAGFWQVRTSSDARADVTGLHARRRANGPCVGKPAHGRTPLCACAGDGGSCLPASPLTP